MPTLAFIVMDATERATARALNDDDFRVDPRLIDNPTADSLGHGTLLGMYVDDAVILENEDYARWHEMYGDNPVLTLNSVDIFLPDEEVLRSEEEA